MVCLAGYNNASETKKHDADAVRYLSYVLYPLLAGYAVYALFYETHKSWYSFVLNTLVGAVYMFGFILMCPQVGPLFLLSHPLLYLPLVHNNLITHVPSGQSPLSPLIFFLISSPWFTTIRSLLRCFVSDASSDCL